ncbi:hypothetical protein DRQ50_08795 [bacterium]|nr:MAG: hypothetical protein DRQ50_08795 [bacterium]
MRPGRNQWEWIVPAVSIRIAVRLALLFPAIVTGMAVATPAVVPTDPVSDLWERDSLTIVVTDSGLGGLSVVADAERKLRDHGVYADVELVFGNALFTAEGGYNSLPGRGEKLQVFSRALQALQDDYDPDLIMIACNTLSVLYPDTDFAASTTIPVVGIVEDGVDLIAGRMENGEPSHTIIFATETTVEEGTHKAALVARGIPADHIFTQACPQLASYIEQGFDGMGAGFLIDAYVGEALDAFNVGAGPLYVSFNCTHYGYSLEAWREAFASREVAVTAFLDPNLTMIDFLLPKSRYGRHANPAVRVSAVSMVAISDDRRESIGRYLRAISPATAAALDDYELRPDLFIWRDLVGDADPGPPAPPQGDAR